MGHRNENGATLVDDPLWYKDAILYEVHVRAFQDASGDGIGDFRGLLDRLDYLQDLGITALWLLPFYPSPLRDDGYDIADYTDVNSIYGTLADVRTLLREAHRRGMRVINELVINHTSDKHPWFQRSRRAPPGSTWRNFYVWSDTADRFKDARIIFKDFEHSNWTWDEEARAYYWHRFYSHQPDLNFDNPAVHRAIFDVVDFWCGLGIDGMRLDAVPYLFEREGTSCENLPETHAFLKTLRKYVDDRYPQRMLLAEANQWPEDAAAYFGAGDECNMAFHFPVMPRLFMAIRMEDRYPIIDILEQTPAISDNSQWALFLRNHDELTLEMVTDEDRDYMYRVYAQDAQARLNLGIRRRLAPLLENHRGKIELMNGLLFSLPGTPVLYYGDEIGMGDNIYLGDRNGVRTPMQWSPERNAGFSCVNPQRLYLPVVIDPEYHYQTINVETQQSNSQSLLWWMKRLIALRKRHQAFGRGSLAFLYPENHKVLVFVRSYQGEQVLVAANLSRFVQCVELDLAAFQGKIPVEMFGRSTLPAIGDGPYQLTLGPYAFYWLLLEPAPAARPATVAAAPLPQLAVTEAWQNICNGAAERLGFILPGYLRTQHWFAATAGAEPMSARIVENFPFDDDACVLLIQVDYAVGEPRRFVLPLAFCEEAGEGAGAVTLPPVESRIATLTVNSVTGGSRKGILFDALADRNAALKLFDVFMRHRRLRGKKGGHLLTRTTAAFHRLLVDLPDPLEPATIKAEQGNTSITFGNRFILKIIRWVEQGMNPEVELAQALAEQTDVFAPLAGTLTYQTLPGNTNGAGMTLGVLSKFIPNEGDAWNYTVESARRFFEHVLTSQEKHVEPLLAKVPFVYAVHEELPAQAVEGVGSYLESARLMGRRTAELHLALAALTDDPAFAPEPWTLDYQRSTYETTRTWWHRVSQQLRRMLPQLPEHAQADAQTLLARDADVVKYLRAILCHRSLAQRIRCHGDYRLGSLLYTGKDFVIIDFGGESLRPLSNRRHKSSPLRDVAAWMLSLHFAVQSVLDDEHLRPDDRPIIEPWAHFWQWWSCVAFVKEYLAAAENASFLPGTREEMQMILDFSLLGRGIYELRYHLVNHPERCHIPLRSILHLLRQRDERR